MENRRDERLNKLAQALKRTDKIHLKDAALLLGVSEMTVRRDLSEHSSSVLLGGYIVSDPKNSHGHYFVSDQQTHNISQKQRLAQVAAALINAHDTVFFDCGTTMPYVIDAIDNQLPFTAVCGAINTFLALKEKPACQIILSGGAFHADNAVFTPLGEHHLLNDICPSLAFISAAGIDVQQGATCYNINELPMKHQVLQRSQRNILVADSSKFGKILPARIGGLQLFSTLVSDSAPPNTLGNVLHDFGVRVALPA